MKDYKLTLVEGTNKEYYHCYRHRDGIWHRKMHHARNEKQQITPDGMELPNQEKIKTLRENKNYEDH